MAEMTDRAGSTAEQMGQQAQNSDWLDKAIRVGLICYGVVHLLIAWLAFQLAFGDHERQAVRPRAPCSRSPSSPCGEVLVWAIADRHVLPGALAAPGGGARATATRKDAKRLVEAG